MRSVKLGRPQENEKFIMQVIDGIEVYISEYFLKSKGKDQKIGLRHLYWGDDLYLLEAEG